MAKTRSEHLDQAIEKSVSTVDESIAKMASMRIGDIVAISEGMHYTIGSHLARNAGEYLVSRLFTDAVFSDDIRAIQLIINRIDGGLPKDTDVEFYQTEFGDCMNKVMDMSAMEQTKIYPEDTVMMALCKNLYQMAVSDIYWNPDANMPRRPSDSVKKERDAALRMVLERVGGRKTLIDVPVEKEEVEIAGWIASLPEITS